MRQRSGKVTAPSVPSAGRALTVRRSCICGQARVYWGLAGLAPPELAFIDWDAALELRVVVTGLFSRHTSLPVADPYSVLTGSLMSPWNRQLIFLTLPYPILSSHLFDTGR